MHPPAILRDSWWCMSVPHSPPSRSPLVPCRGLANQCVTRRSERDRRPDGALYECVGEACSEAMDCLPAGAMRGHQQLGLEVIEGRDCWLDDGLEHRAAEVEPADDGGDGRLPGEHLRVSHDVDDPGVTTSGQHHKAATR